VARFWREPYAPRRLARWGSELHDRFLLPHFVRLDFEDVLAEQAAAGFELPLEWFAPHFEFRFPKLGDLALRCGLLELRHALEPWHVMGEEGGGAGTVRYVDSSVERVQVRLTGLAPDRYAVTCNGRTLALQPTARPGEFVAGVRYRAWQPPTCLHPTIPCHAPLVFDLVDTWMGRSVGGCTYSVSHPGGRFYETYPINAYEAESRRHSRFSPFGHTPGPFVVPAEERNPEAPMTLDLRRPIRPPGPDRSTEFDPARLQTSSW
jgi:uncharacterized protein (DUF2126 family)